MSPIDPLNTTIPRTWEPDGDSPLFNELVAELGVPGTDIGPTGRLIIADPTTEPLDMATEFASADLTTKRGKAKKKTKAVAA